VSSEIQIQPLGDEYREWALSALEKHWGALEMLSRWRWHDLRTLDAFIALVNGEPAGLSTYYFQGGQCEVVTLNSFVEDRGVGEALLFAVRDAAKAAGCKRLWLTTANSNLRALQFYQKRDMAIVAVHRFAIDEARKVKPDIPLYDVNGIPLRDELELEMLI
jgi:ribosomal protein S18 acetylase RimI-like enzyme